MIFCSEEATGNLLLLLLLIRLLQEEPHSRRKSLTSSGRNGATVICNLLPSTRSGNTSIGMYSLTTSFSSWIKKVKKRKFTTGIVDSVKVDPDKVVRKVTVRYKLKQKTGEEEYTPTVTKYVERHVRGLALLVTAEERKNLEEIDVDGYQKKISPQEDCSNVVGEEEEHLQEEEPDKDLKVEDPSKTGLKPLPPSSTGRKRWAPNRN